ncbi:hypothetical protein BZA77DRAFT_388866 [Pyronema omphalodes]|nr:hypothetical protein BZA77DRAFT_388866 [Pyronema omphalodes]
MVRLSTSSLSLFSRSSTNASTASPPSRIALIDNTVSAAATPRSQSPSALPEAAVPRRSTDNSKRETLRRAIAKRRYKKWSLNPGSEEPTDSEGDLEEAPDARAGGVVVERDFGDTQQESERGRQQDRAAVNSAEQRRRKQEIAEIDVLYENQRGAFVCGLPLFSSKSLLNFDPSPWQNIHFRPSAVSILDAQVPDPSWVWDWKTWYVDMTSDVDEEGWAYSFSFSPAFAWHGNHVWFHSFVRRRRWLRKRIKLPTTESGTPLTADYGSSRAGSVDRAHRLNNDYFTIHSRRDPEMKAAAGDWGGSGGEEEDTDVRDIPKLMAVVKHARLDREKIEAVMRFVEDGGDEIAYLAEKMPTLMASMVFQASRRQLLAHLVDYADQYNSGKAPLITILVPTPLISNPPTVAHTPSAGTPAVSPGSEAPATSSAASILGAADIANTANVLSPGITKQPGRDAIPSHTAVSKTTALVDPFATASLSIAGKHPSADSPAFRARKTENLKKATAAADAEVKRLEFWSDIKDIVRKGESAGAVGEGWEDIDSELGLSGPSMGNEKVFGGAGGGGTVESRETVGGISSGQGVREERDKRDKGKGRA